MSQIRKPAHVLLSFLLLLAGRAGMAKDKPSATQPQRRPSQAMSYYYQCTLSAMSDTSRAPLFNFTMRTPDDETELMYNQSNRAVTMNLRIDRAGELFLQIREYEQDKPTASKLAKIEGFSPYSAQQPAISLHAERKARSARGRVIGYLLECK
ncbi:MAG: hypothetical protein NDI61_05160 [Bdellovibrionaceae bacterium]|nr:hypothetical protein [Pseudobdellovibrionaceae bacterium]